MEYTNSSSSFIRNLLCEEVLASPLVSMKINNNYSSRFFGELLNNTTDYSSSAYNRQGQARPTPGARNFIWISIMGSRNQSTWAIIDRFPDVLAGGSISTSTE